MKVIYLTNLPVPYKIEFFNHLSKYVDLTVVFERRNAQNRDVDWLSKGGYEFEAVFLNGINYGDESTISIDINAFLKRKKYDLFIIGGYSSLTSILAIFLLRIKRMQFVLALDGAIYKKNNWIIDKIKKILIRSANWYLSTSIETDKYLLNFGAKENEIYRVPLSSVRKKDIIPRVLSKGEKLEHKKKIGINEEFMVVAVGQFIRRKGFDILLKSLVDVHHNISVCIIGGKITKEYSDILKSSPINNVIFIDFMTSEKLSTFYKAADVFVLPTREDIWGLVVNEAMAHGLPIISTNKCIGAIELLRNSGAGFIVASEKPDELSNRINQIIKDNNLREAMSENSLKEIKKHTIEEMSTVYHSAMLKMLDKNKV